MALTSPGVEVSIIDESQYLPSAGGSVPLIILATAQNKADASATGVAAATTAANANKLFLVTSQRDLVNLYGSPFFYSTTNGTSIHGYELNEYGLLAAYSLLGVTNRCYVLRADVDLASLVGHTGRPTGRPADGTYWLDSVASTWGIYEFNAVTGKFANKIPIVITSALDLTNDNTGTPKQSIGNVGDYAVNAMQITGAPAATRSRQYFYKTRDNTWQVVGGPAWTSAIPTVQGTQTVNSTTPLTGNFTIGLGDSTGELFNVTITAPATVGSLVSQIQGLGWTYVTASITDGKFVIHSKNPSGFDLTDPAQVKYVTIAGSPLVLGALGVTASNYNQPALVYGTSAQMPLWTSSQDNPRPTGSVWIKVGDAGNGLTPILNRYSRITQLWSNLKVPLNTSDWAVTATLDASGGKAIAAGTVYGQYGFNGEYNTGPIYLWERIATGPTVVEGTVDNPVLDAGGQLLVKVSTPGSGSLSADVYTVNIASGVDISAAEFVTAWAAAAIPFTSAAVTTSGSIQLVHTEGGEISITDVFNGASTGVLTACGFIIGTTEGCKYGLSVPVTYANAPSVKLTGNGQDATITLTAGYGEYVLNAKGVSNGGTLYQVGDRLKVLGSDIGGVDVVNDLVVRVTGESSGVITSVTFESGVDASENWIQLSNWRDFTYTANEGALVADPANNTNWFHSVTDQVDIMIQKAGAWKGYRTTNYDAYGHPTTGTAATDPAGPLIAASAPEYQSDGTALVPGDLWIDTGDLENYPVISRWELVGTEYQWVLIDNTDQTSSNGIVFADARWATSGSVNPTNDPIASITSLLTSNYLDLDAPQATLYPQGTLLFNTRRSGYTVKQYKTTHFNMADFPDQVLPQEKAAWVTTSGNKADGSPYMGRKAQRAMVVEALNSVVATNTAARDEDNYFNLMACPGYPELQPGMVTMNNDRGMTAYILGDTPMRLADSATDIQAWATNAAGATSTGEDGCVTRDTYLGLFYPSGISVDLAGNQVVVPSSHMMLRTFIRNDNIAYPWLAAAGTRRGIIDNASNIGYLESATGEFKTIKTRLGIRDTLYTNMINPMVYFTGVGLLNYGNKTSFNSSSALDRTNVARLVCYMRRQLTLATRPFVFEPNDTITRAQIGGVVQTLMADLVSKRGLYDYLVVCDESNNTPARIDRNELWIDVAVEPVKAAEFIYIPVRILNTGELSA